MRRAGERLETPEKPGVNRAFQRYGLEEYQNGRSGRTAGLLALRWKDGPRSEKRLASRDGERQRTALRRIAVRLREKR